MKFRKNNWLIGTLVISIFISACNIGASAPTQDPNAVQTQAFEIAQTQIVIQQSQTAAAISPTPIPTDTALPTNTFVPTAALFPVNTPFALNTQQSGFPTLALNASPTVVSVISTTTTKNGCNDGYLISESAPYDGKIMALGTEFDKSWEFINVGTCTWDEGYSFAFIEEISTASRLFKDYVIPKTGTFVKPGETVTFTVKLKAPKTPGEYIWYYKLKDDAGNYFGSLVWTKIVVVK